MKMCTKCKKEKHFDEFYKDLQKKDGLHCACKECKNKDAKIYRSKNSEKIKLANREWSRKTREKAELSETGLQIIKLAKEFEILKDFRDKYPLKYSYAHKLGIEKIAFSHLKRSRVYRKDNPLGRVCRKCGVFKTWDFFYNCISSKNTKRKQSFCKSCQNIETTKWRKENTDRTREYVSKSAKKHPENARRAKRKYRQKHPEAFLARDLLKRVLKLTGKRKEEITQKALGYGFEELRKHIEDQFAPGMNWDNWGKWQVDHIKPLCIFIDEKIHDPKIINALSNLRPLWAEENIARTRRRWKSDNS